MRLAACFAIGFCIEGAAWLFWPLANTHLVAMIAVLAFCIGLVVARRGTPVRAFDVGLHLELQATLLGSVAGFQLFELYPEGRVASHLVLNVLSGAGLALVVGLFGTAALLAMRRMTPAARRRVTPAGLTLLATAAVVLGALPLAGYEPRPGPPRPPPPEPIYDASLDVDKAITQATAGEHRHALLMLGGNWCGWCYLLHDLLNDDPRIRRLIDERYRLIHVDIRANEWILQRYGVTPRGYPFLIVLDDAGNLVAAQNTDEFVEAGQKYHSPRRVHDFLERCLE